MTVMIIPHHLTASVLCNIRMHQLVVSKGTANVSMQQEHIVPLVKTAYFHPIKYSQVYSLHMHYIICSTFV